MISLHEQVAIYRQHIFRSGLMASPTFHRTIYKYLPDMPLVFEILMLKLVHTKNLMSVGHVTKGANSGVFENFVYIQYI